MNHHSKKYNNDESCTSPIEKHRILFGIGIDALNTTRKPLNYRPISYHGDESCTTPIEKHRILFGIGIDALNTTKSIKLSPDQLSWR